VPVSPVAAIVSFRLNQTDGVSVVAESWAGVLRDLGFEVRTVAGDGPVDRLLPGLAIGAETPPSSDEVTAALAGADLVVAENLCTIPLNLPAARVVSEALRGRPAILHHHDPPWQRAHFAHITELPPDDPAWQHVTINRLTERQLRERGFRAVTTIYNGFAVDVGVGDRAGTRAALGVADDALLFAHPVRAIPRKDVPAALRACEAADAVYWLLGPAEDGYGPELDKVLAAARCPVIHRRVPGTMDDAYAAADAVVFPSTWEGFGNPPIEAALHTRPALVGCYPVAAELRELGFDWFEPGQGKLLGDAARHPGLPPYAAMLDANRRLAQEAFSLERLAGEVRALLGRAGWWP
jgi:glycosyltransferase involved in cell wall biosynthesis